MMQKVDEVIEKICERIIEDCTIKDSAVLSEEVKALAELVSARAMNI